MAGTKGSGDTSSNPKRKFLPNIRNALNKQIVSNDRPAKVSRKDSKTDGSTVQRPNKPPGRGGSSARAPVQDGQSRFVQSYSIFESGIGCVVKTEKNAVELCEARPSASGRIEVSELHETEQKQDPLEDSEAFVTDIKQEFKDAPAIMQDSAAGVQPPIDPLRDMDLSESQNHRVPFEFFRDSEMGRLFTLQLPDQMLPTDFDQIKEGSFGKIQLLDNQQVRLVVGGATFDLISPRALSYSSDVILVDDRGDDLIRLNCLGHLDQSLVAVPNLEEFVRIGQ
ncbi:Rab gap:tbc [Fasciola hepatica]|uniref:Rab gap:tbc n=1 Tax=Fasciola hepatica TaxID=6192 RepID=A0A4E0REY2_FASHE|nr:Rab gap:tbc [Fasciola hepatica]